MNINSFLNSEIIPTKPVL